MRILFLSHRLPYPPNEGGKIRAFNMIRYLSQYHSVVVASLAHSIQELEEGARLKDYCEDVIAEVLPNSARWLQALRALPTKTPSSVAYFSSARLYKRLRERFFSTEFDIVLVHCAFVAQYVMDIKSCFRIMDFCDIDSGKWAEYSERMPFPSSQVYARESRKLRRYEREVARVFDHCMVATQAERDDFNRLQVSTPCAVVPNGVDVTYFSSTGDPERPGVPSIVFLGRMDYFPNIDGVCYFAEKILPLIREKIPHAEFRVVGSNPAKRVRELAKIPQTSVTGHVPDVRPYLSENAVGIAPLRIARGTQNKILESMAMGVPVVATPNAAKGIQAVPGRDLLVGTTPTEFANHVIDLLQNVELRRSLSRAARKQVEQAHLWPVAMKTLDELLAPLCLS